MADVHTNNRTAVDKDESLCDPTLRRIRKQQCYEFCRSTGRRKACESGAEPHWWQYKLIEIRLNGICDVVISWNVVNNGVIDKNAGDDGHCYLKERQKVHIDR